MKPEDDINNIVVNCYLHFLCSFTSMTHRALTIYFYIFLFSNFKKKQVTDLSYSLKTYS